MKKQSPKAPLRDEPAGRSSLLPTLTLTLIVVGAFLIRFPGVTWELPGELHTFGYHPDELMVLAAASRIAPSEGQFNPGFYNYGTLQMYVLALPAALATTQDGLNLGMGTLLGRLVTVLFALGTVALCWRAGWKVAGFGGAVLAAVFIAVAPLHVQQSQFVTVDVPATFWVAGVLLAVVESRTALAGFLAGLAAATKYTVGIAIVAPLAAVAQRHGVRGGWKPAAVACALAAVGFVIGVPGVLLWTGDFLNGFLFEVGHAGEGHGLVFQDTGLGWIYHLLHSLLPGMGWPLLIFSVAGSIYAAAKGGWQIRSVAAFALIYFLFIGAGNVRFARYTLPLYPAFAIMAAFILQTANRKMVAAVGAGVMVLTAGYALVLESHFAKPDPRTEAAAWIQQNVNEAAVVALPTPPWFYTPPLAPGFGLLTGRDRLQSALDESAYDIRVPEEDWGVDVLDSDPEVVVISNYESQDRQRLSDKMYLEFMERLTEEYEPAARFGGDGPVRPFILVPSLPHDMQYVSPTLTIYRRKA